MKAPQLPSLSRFSVNHTEHLLEVRINRPDKANALDMAAWYELRDIFHYADSNEAIRVVILSGEGKHFSAGIDLSMLADMKNQVADTCQAQQNERLRRLILDLQDTVSTIARCSKPVIAAIHGACVGGGLDIASACDIRYAATGSKFSIKEVDLAIVADLGSLQRLPRIISPAQVAELAFTGRALSAEEALQAGLISKVLESEEALLTYTREVASIIAAKSPLTIRGIKQVLAYSLTHSIEEGLQHVATWNSATLLSADLQEAVTAQIQKRSPQFR